jgi:16S rRNA (adenine1518-N6/adenine1519-N6)-dimethyltransferase
MPLFRPSELLAFLGSIGVRPKRTLSQNFLIDGNVVQKIVRASIDSTSPLIVEIGPGPGVLTEAFLAKGLRVVAVEKDEKLASYLYRLDPTRKLLEVKAKDILSCSLSSLVGDRKDTVVVSNLPYHLTSPILEWLVESRDSFSRALIMMQDEVAKKLLASNKPSSYMQVVLSLFFDLSYLFRVSKNCFYPVPKVDSALVLFNVHEPPIREKRRQDAFLAFVAHAFSHRRKMLRNSLSDLVPKKELERALSPFGANARPEEIKCEGWVELFCALEKDL